MAFRYYSSTTGTWNTSNIWTSDFSGTTPASKPVAGDTAEYNSSPNSGSVTSDLAAAQTVSTLIFNNIPSSVTINSSTGNSLTVNSIVATANGATATINAPVVFASTSSSVLHSSGNTLLFTNSVSLSNGGVLSFNKSNSTATTQFNSGITSSSTMDVNTSGTANGVIQVGGTSNFRNLSITGVNWRVNSSTALGTGTVTINSGVISAAQNVTNSSNNPISILGDFDFNVGIYGSDLLIGSGAVTLGANSTIYLSAGTLTVGGIISGSRSLTVTGSGLGTLKLTNINTYSGGTTINNQGSVLIGYAGALGSGSISLGQSTVGCYINTTLSNSVSMSSSISYDKQAFLEFSGATTLLSNVTFDGVKTGSSWLTLSGKISGAYNINVRSGALFLKNTENDYTGKTTVSSGATLMLWGAVLGSPSDTFSNLVLQGGSKLTAYNHTILGTGISPVFETTNDVVTISVMSPGGSLTFQGTSFGTLGTSINISDGVSDTLVNMNGPGESLISPINVNVGELAVGLNGIGLLGLANGGSLGNLTLSAGTSVRFYRNNTTFRNVYLNSANSTSGRAYSLRLEGTATHGSISVSVSNINISASGSLISSNNYLNTFYANNLFGSTFPVNFECDTGGELTIATKMSGTGVHTYNNDSHLGTIILNGLSETSDYSGLNYLYGEIRISYLANAGSSSCLGTGTSSVSPNRIIYLGYNETTYSSSLVFTGSSLVSNRPIHCGKTVSLDGVTGTLVLSGGISWSPGNGGSTLTLDGISNTGTISGAITNDSAGTSIIKNGNGNWTLSGTNTHSGTITVNSGVLKLASLNATGSTSSTNPITINAGACVFSTSTSFNIGSRPFNIAGSGVASFPGALVCDVNSNIGISQSITLTGSSHILVKTGSFLLSTSGLNKQSYDLTFNCFGGDITCRKVITGTSGTITKVGTNLLELESFSASNSYGSGNILLYQGSIRLTTENRETITPVSGGLVMTAGTSLTVSNGTLQKGSVLITGDLSTQGNTIAIGY